MTTTATKSRPILFSAPMVRAILAGQKSVTRRIATARHIPAGTRTLRWENQNAEELAHVCRCPYGSRGDELWVREACKAEEKPDGLDGVRYLADGAFRPIEDTAEAADAWVKLNTYRNQRGATVPPIHMPRWASRIALRITDVRVERVQDITTEEIEREGWKRREGIADEQVHADAARDAFMDLWDKLNGTGSWASNCWVWVVSFERVEAR